MRRFEFVEGTSAKFWMASVEGATFIVVYGRLGTDGQRKEKAFPSEDAARRELEKKINEKLREGYHEVAAGAAGAAPPSSGGPKAKGAAAAAPRLALPPRLVPVDLKAGPDGARDLHARPHALPVARQRVPLLADGLRNVLRVLLRARKRERHARRRQRHGACRLAHTRRARSMLENGLASRGSMRGPFGS